MPVYPYTKSKISKKTKKRVYSTWYMYEGTYIYPVTKISVRYKKRGFEKEGIAKKAEQLFLTEVGSGNYATLTFGTLFKSYRNSRELMVKARSVTDFNYLYNRMIKSKWEQIKIKDIKIDMVKIWQNELLAATYEKPLKKDGVVVKDNDGNTLTMKVRYSNEYLKSTQALFKTVLNYGVSLGYNIPTPILKISIVQNKQEMKKEMLIWEPEEFERFINVIDDTQYIALFNILYWCGLRIGEVLALTFGDIDFKKSMITVNKTYDQKNRVFTAPKTQNSYRNIMMPEKCLKTVKRWHDEANYYEQTNKHIVFGINQPLDDNTIRRKKEKWCATAEVKNIRIHDLRHSHVSLLIHLGFNSFDIAKRLGHSPEMVNNRYGHWFKNSQDKMVDKLNQL